MSWPCDARLMCARWIDLTGYLRCSFILEVRLSNLTSFLLFSYSILVLLLTLEFDTVKTPISIQPTPSAKIEFMPMVWYCLSLDVQDLTWKGHWVALLDLVTHASRADLLLGLAGPQSRHSQPWVLRSRRFWHWQSSNTSQESSRSRPSQQMSKLVNEVLHLRS